MKRLKVEQLGSTGAQRGTLTLGGKNKSMLNFSPEGLARTLFTGVSRFSGFSYEGVEAFGYEEVLSLKMGLKLSPACFHF